MISTSFWTAKIISKTNTLSRLGSYVSFGDITGEGDPDLILSDVQTASQMVRIFK